MNNKGKNTTKETPRGLQPTFIFSCNYKTCDITQRLTLYRDKHSNKVKLKVNRGRKLRLWPTYRVGFTEASGDHVVHVAVFTELQLRQVHLHLAMLHKHPLFNHLGGGGGNPRQGCYKPSKIIHTEGNPYLIKYKYNICKQAFADIITVHFHCPIVNLIRHTGIKSH